MRTIDRTRLREYIGKLNSDTMQYVDRAIAVSFGLDGILGMRDESGRQSPEERPVVQQAGKRAWIYCAIDAQFQILTEKYGISVYCPLEGRIYFDHG